MKSLVAYWRDRYDWRAQEAELNARRQFHGAAGGIDLHFITSRGWAAPDAAAALARLAGFRSSSSGG